MSPRSKRKHAGQNRNLLPLSKGTLLRRSKERAAFGPMPEIKQPKTAFGEQFKEGYPRTLQRQGTKVSKSKKVY